MEDSRVFGSRSRGVKCKGNVRATRCTIEDNGDAGVHVISALTVRVR